MTAQEEIDLLINEQRVDDITDYQLPSNAMDALAVRSHVVPFSELEDEQVSPLNRAGMDDLTPVDTFIGANGGHIYVTEDY